MSRSPKGKWQFVLDIAVFVQNLTAVAMIDVNFDVWWYSYTSAIGFLDFFVSLVYTIWYYGDQPIKGLLAFSMMGILIPVFHLPYFCQVLTNFCIIPNNNFSIPLLVCKKLVNNALHTAFRFI